MQYHDQLSIVKKIVFKYLDPHDYSVFIFGSRASGQQKKYSDIDLGIESKKPVKSSTIIAMQQEFEDSDLPFTVDIVDFTKVSERFKKVAKQRMITL